MGCPLADDKTELHSEFAHRKIIVIVNDQIIQRQTQFYETSEEQIVYARKQAESGVKVADLSLDKHILLDIVSKKL